MKLQRGRFGWIVALLLAATAYHFLSSRHQANAVDSTPASTPSQAPAVHRARWRGGPLPSPATCPRRGHRPPEEMREREVAACQAEHTRAIRQRMASLAHSADARERASYAVMLPLMGSPTDERFQRQAFGAAMDLAPDDALIAWYAAQNCRAPGCDSRAAIERLLRIDSDNIFAWLLAAGDELERGDLVQADRLLQRAARAPRADAYFGQTALLVTESIGPLPQTPACARAAAMLGAQMALGRPATMEDLTVNQCGDRCRDCTCRRCGRSLSSVRARRRWAPHRLSACRALFARLARQQRTAVPRHGRSAGWQPMRLLPPSARNGGNARATCSG